jgi:hypothetical protein
LYEDAAPFKVWQTASGSGLDNSMSGLRRGDLVEVRPGAEILATLDADGCLEGVPFMPEMLRHIGHRFTVEARVERACDTITQKGARRMPNTVLLDDLRCDGSAHGGCQAGCRLYWKEAWLRRVSADEPQASSTPDDGLEQRALASTRADGAGERERYRCQATELLRATEPIGWWDPRSFGREVRCGNVRPWRFARVTVRALFEEVLRRLRLFPGLPVEPRGEGSGSRERLDLAPGERVRVRSKAEIAQTLGADGTTRGLWFDREMLPYCGRTHAVKRRVERFIDEGSGELVELASDAVILDGVICGGDLSYGRWFCPRAIYPWWRECWLERAEEPQDRKRSV